jgi:hypothetical protein
MQEIHQDPNVVLLAEAYEMGYATKISVYDTKTDDCIELYGYVSELLNDGLILLMFNYTDITNIDSDMFIAKTSINFQDIHFVESPITYEPKLQKRINEFIYDKKAITGFNVYKQPTGTFQDVKDLYKHESTFIKQAEATFKEMKNHAIHGVNGYTTEVELTYPEDREFEVKPTMLQALKDKIKILFGMRL